MKHCHRTIACLALAFTIVFRADTPVFAGAPEALVVAGHTELDAAHSPYRYSGIHVLSQGELLLGPGVELILSDGAEVLVEGKLETADEPASPVLIHAETGLWQGFLAVSSSSLRLHRVQLERFKDPVRLFGSSIDIGDVSLIDGIDNRLFLGSPEGQYGRLSVAGLAFEARSLGGTMQSLGLVVQGTYTSVTFSEVHLRTSQALPIRPGVDPLVEVRGVAALVEFEHLSFPGNCRNQTRTFVPGVLWQLEADPSTCVRPVIPIVFVPGYGTSINLEQLASLDLWRDLNPEGWRFFESLVPAYVDFINEVQAQHIPLEVAYYDWRLPAAESARRYLQPAIERAKLRYGSATVNIVAHSFGGIVARSYIQSEAYAQDVATFVEEGTPNFGAAKAYGVWEGGVLPEGWETLGNLLRYYSYADGSHPSQLATIRTYAPSARELLPTYPGALAEPVFRLPAQWVQANGVLLSLEENSGLLHGRTRVISVFSRSELTKETVAVGAAEGDDLWADGQPLLRQPSRKRSGDGTVPMVSALLAGAEAIEVSGLHADLPSAASEAVLKALYPQLLYRSPRAAPGVAETYLSFLFDCPVEVTVVLPDGRSRSTAEPDLTPSSALSSPVGEVATSAEITWVVVPRQDGYYEVTVRALDDTPVRAWVGDGPIRTVELKKGEAVYWRYNDRSGMLTDRPGQESYKPVHGPVEPGQPESVQGLPGFLALEPELVLPVESEGAFSLTMPTDPVRILSAFALPVLSGREEAGMPDETIDPSEKKGPESVPAKPYSATAAKLAVACALIWLFSRSRRK